jgi:hypothetical protein
MERVVGHGARSVIRNLPFFRGGSISTGSSNDRSKQAQAAETGSAGSSTPATLKRNFSSYDALSSTFPGFFSKRRRKQQHLSSLPSNESSTPGNPNHVETENCTRELVIESDDENDNKGASSGGGQGAIQTKSETSLRASSPKLGDPLVSTTPVGRIEHPGRTRRGKRRKASPLNLPAVSSAAAPNTIDENVFDFRGGGSPDVVEPQPDRAGQLLQTSAQVTTLASDMKTAHQESDSAPKKTSGFAFEDEGQFAFTDGTVGTSQSRRTPQVKLPSTRAVNSERNSAIKVPSKVHTPPSVARDVKTMWSAPARRRKKDGVRNSETTQEQGNLSSPTSEASALEEQGAAAKSASCERADNETKNGGEKIETMAGSQTHVRNEWSKSNGVIENVRGDESKLDLNSVGPANDNSPHPNSDVETNNGGSNSRSIGTAKRPVEEHDYVDGDIDLPVLKLPPALAPHNNPGFQESWVVLTSRLRSSRYEKQGDQSVHTNGCEPCKGMTAGNAHITASAGGSGATCNGAVESSEHRNVHRELERNLKEKFDKCHPPIKMTKQHRPLFRNVSGTYQCATIRFDGARCVYQAVGKTGHCSRHLSDKVDSNMACSAKADKKQNDTSGAQASSLSNSDTDSGGELMEDAVHRNNAEVSSKQASIEWVEQECDVNKGGDTDAEATHARSSSIEDASGGIINDNSTEVIETEAELSACKQSQLRPPSVGYPVKSLPSLGSAIQDIQRLRELACLNDRCVFVRDKKRCESQCTRGSVFCAVHDSEGISSASGEAGETIENDSTASPDTSKKPVEPLVVSKYPSLNDTLQPTSNDKSSDSSDDHSSDDENDTSEDDDSNPQGQPSSRTYTHSEFLSMWHRCEELFGEGTDEIESTRRVRAANQKMNPDDTDGQLKAQYGRLLPLGMKRMMEILELRKDDVFLDVGHGIGNTCLHAAFCIGCDARGIEVVSGRHSIAEVFRDQLISQNRAMTPPRAIGGIDLRLGRLEDPTHTEFLTKGVTRAYVNNFSGVFAERSSKNDQKWFLDDYVAGLFALLEPGAIMITFHPLNLGLDREGANEQRKKHNLTESGNSSFFVFERLALGKACKTVKWNIRSGNQTEIQVYKYTRVRQPSEGRAVFLCTNPQCPKARNAVPIDATMENEEGRCVLAHCSCRFSPKNLRKQSKKVYAA